MGLAAYGSKDLYPKLTDNNFEHIKVSFNGALPTSMFKGLQGKIAKDITPKNFKFYADPCQHVQTDTQQEALELIILFKITFITSMRIVLINTVKQPVLKMF